MCSQDAPVVVIVTHGDFIDSLVKTLLWGVRPPAHNVGFTT